MAKILMKFQLCLTQGSMKKFATFDKTHAISQKWYKTLEHSAGECLPAPPSFATDLASSNSVARTSAHHRYTVVQKTRTNPVHLVMLWTCVHCMSHDHPICLVKLYKCNTFQQLSRCIQNNYLFITKLQHVQYARKYLVGVHCHNNKVACRGCQS